MRAEIVPLVCPQCGFTCKQGPQDRTFGAEFKCDACGVVSALVINQRLYVKVGNEHVCVDCGRVTRDNAKYCQCGNSLLRVCENTKCCAEIFTDDRVCSTCGWDQTTAAGSMEVFGMKLKELQRGALAMSSLERERAWADFDEWVTALEVHHKLENGLIDGIRREVIQITVRAFETIDYEPFGPRSWDDHYPNPGYLFSRLGTQQDDLIAHLQTLARSTLLKKGGLWDAFIDLLCDVGVLCDVGGKAVSVLDYLIFERYKDWRKWDGAKDRLAHAVQRCDRNQILKRKVGWLTPSEVRDIFRVR